MSQVMFTYPAMLAHADSMDATNGGLRSVGSALGAEQGALAANWQGDSGMTYQSWQQQWNSAHEELTSSYQAMTDAHRNNTLTMWGRDQAEGAKWV